MVHDITQLIQSKKFENKKEHYDFQTGKEHCFYDIFVMRT